MEFIANMSALVLIILFFYTIYLVFKCRKTNDWKPFKHSLIAMLVCFIITGICGNASSSSKDSSSNKKSGKAEKIAKRTAKKSSSIIISKKQISSTEKTTKKTSINDELAKSLSEDQGYAQKGNSDFVYANYINSVKYTGNAQITVYVNNDFLNLDNQTKTNYLNQVQGMAGSVLLDHNKISDDDFRQGLFITINNGQNSIGSSKISNYKEYHFDK